jgi:carbon-monoxide dehydrogenase large subunit
MSDTGVGASLHRKEDRRFLRGRGRYVSDMQAPGMLEAAIVRSPLAHARIRDLRKPTGAEHRVFAAGDMTDVAPFRVVLSAPGYKAADYPHLATGKVRFVGEAVAVCLGETRAEAEDLSQRVELDLDPLDPVVDMLAAGRPDSAKVHDEWDDNVILETIVQENADAIDEAPVVVAREFRMSRQATNPMEGAAVLAEWDARDERLVVHSATQIPHVLRTALSECLGLEHRQIRVIAPDVGGGFGYRCVLLPEEIYIPWIALQVGRPVRWVQDRQEHLIAGANAREHHYKVSLHADENGRFVGLRGEITVDAGAYSVYPFSNVLDGGMAARSLSGPYRFDAYDVVGRSMATNKPPIVPYRGVARPGVCFALELLIDALAREIGREPHEVREQNLVPAGDMPFTTISGNELDSGDYPEAVRRAAQSIDVAAVRRRQQRGEPDGRLIGHSVVCYMEMTALQTAAAAARGIPAIPGYEQASVRLTPDGGLEIAVGVQNHGQGMETTLAQVASEVLGIDAERISVCHGDTALSPYSTGTWGSRSMTMAGGAVTRSCRALAERMKVIGAHLLQCETADVAVADGMVTGPGGSVSIAEIARVWYRHPEELPAGVDPGGVELTGGFRPDPERSPYSYGAHAAVVAVDPELGEIEILDYVIVEDCGTMVNPMIVAGQVWGGALQGIGTALCEESVYADDGQPLSSTFADYLMPGPTHVPTIRIEHLINPASNTEFGVKGLGEGGAIPPPAVIGNAVNDALAGIGAEVSETPISPPRVLAAINRAREAEEKR